jgi:hypothetical protein
MLHSNPWRSTCAKKDERLRLATLQPGNSQQKKSFINKFIMFSITQQNFNLKL